MSREAKRVLRDELAAVREKKAELEGQETALEAAIEALGGAVPRRRGGGRGPNRGPQIPAEKRDVQVLDLVRKANGPVTVADLVNSDGVPYSSTLRSFERLIEAGKVRQTGTTAAKKPIVEYVPVKVRPGEGVVE